MNEQNKHVIREVELGGVEPKPLEEEVQEPVVEPEAEPADVGLSAVEPSASESSVAPKSRHAGRILAIAGVMAMLLVGGFFGGRALHGVIWATNDSEVAQEETEPNQDVTNVDNSNNGEKEPEENPEEKPEEKEETKPPETQPVVPSKPATTTNPVAEVPASATGRKLVALTFDDGPSVATTGRLLDILRDRGVKATFFVVGSMAQRAPDLLRREIAEGHEVGSHSLSHQNLAALSAEGIRWETTEMDRIFTEILGRKVDIMRPPYGNVSDIMRSYLGKPMIYWSVDPLDWKYRNTTTVRANVVGATFDGAVVLLHDIHSTSVDAVPGIIDDLRAQGYEFLTVSELAAARGVPLQSGTVYYSFKLY